MTDSMTEAYREEKKKQEKKQAKRRTIRRNEILIQLGLLDIQKLELLREEACL